MRIIRASEVGSYLFCARAWWYRLQGIESTNQAEMIAGTELHHQHGRKVITAGLAQIRMTVHDPEVAFNEPIDFQITLVGA